MVAAAIQYWIKLNSFELHGTIDEWEGKRERAIMVEFDA